METLRYVVSRFLQSLFALLCIILGASRPQAEAAAPG